jgi:hypothetical protein
MSFSFSLIRFVPDPARGEFVNIGAIAGDETAQDWDLRFISNFRRARALDTRGALSAAIAFATGLGDSIQLDEQLELAGPEPTSNETLTRLSEESQNIVQFTRPAPVQAGSSEEALDLVFEHLVLDPTALKFRFEKKHRAQSSTRQAYSAHNVPADAVKERARIASGAFDDTFDFAVHNGRAVQLVQCWSFQLPDQGQLAEQVKAWSWVVHEVRKQGGELSTNSGTIEVPGETQIAAVCIPPAKGGEAPAFAEAKAAFAENDVQQLSPEEADRLGAEARQLLIPG